MNPALQEFLRAGTPGPEQIDRFLADHDFPLVTEHEVTFVYRGAADAIYLKCWISGFDRAHPFRRIEETDLWISTLELPPGSRIEYKFDVVRNGQGELVIDPLNPVHARDPFGANSVCQAHGYERPEWTAPDDRAQPGALTRFEIPSQAFGEARTVGLYLPGQFRRNRRYPLLVVHDGFDYLEFAALQTVLDNLIQAREIPQLLVALTQSPDRLTEYAGDDRHARFLGEELLPYIDQRFPLRKGAGARGLLGASFGGVAALHAAWRYPEHWGRLLLQSGSFAFSDFGRHHRPSVFDPVVEFMNAFRADEVRPAERIYLSCGIYESLIYENRSLVPQLQARGSEVKFEEVRDAHNWENWRDRLRSGLSWLFPGPLWMVYD